jgi:general stress protein 26
MTTKAGRSERLSKLTELIEDIRIAMLTTAMPDGTLRSRPMATLQTESDGDLWFFTQASAAKAEEIRANPHVNVSYASPRENRYISVSGMATIVRDRNKMEQLWDQLYKAWFPQGLEDPDLALLRIDVERAEYWDAPSGTMAEIAGFVKAAATGRPADIGENEKIDFQAGRE